MTLEVFSHASVLYNSPVSSRRIGFLFFLFFLLLSCAAALAQAPPKAKLSYKLLSVHVKGLEHFTEDQILAASGLKLGQYAGEEQFKQAAQKLGETGLFAQLTYTYQYSTAGCDLELQVAENQKLVPVVFDNFVWFSDEELIRMLHSRVPLFNGRVPEGGNLNDQLAQALTAILNERKISGQVLYIPSAAENGPVESFEFTLRMHSVAVRKVDFPGAAADEIPQLQAAAKSLIGQDYLGTKMRAQERLNFLPVYYARGYLKAEFAEARPRVVEDGARTIVDVSVPVNPGIQYKLADLQFAGNEILPAEKLRELIHLKSGEPANSVELEDDLEQIHKLYGTKGYLLAHVEAVPTMDDSRATVTYHLNVIEDELFRMGELNIDGIPPENAKKMAAQWQLKKGDPFDNSYLQTFFAILYRDFGLHRSYNVVPKQAINRQEKTVSVSLHFVPQG